MGARKYCGHMGLMSLLRYWTASHFYLQRVFSKLVSAENRLQIFIDLPGAEFMHKHIWKTRVAKIQILKGNINNMHQACKKRIREHLQNFKCLFISIYFLVWHMGCVLWHVESYQTDCRIQLHIPRALAGKTTNHRTAQKVPKLFKNVALNFV